MGIKIIKNKKRAYVLESKNDCVLYLMHLLEYTIKKKEVFYNNFLFAVTHLATEVQRKGIILDSNENMLKFIFSDTAKELDFEIDFNYYKLFISAINLSKNEIYNIIGDYSKDKRSISYYNYMDIIDKKSINDVKNTSCKEKLDLLKSFNAMRNYNSHFTSDKLIEWIEFREKQLKEKGYDGFPISKDFNVYISKKIPVVDFIRELQAAYLFFSELIKIIEYMTEDYNLLIDTKINVQIKDTHYDFSAVIISENGIKSHMTSSGIT